MKSHLLALLVLCLSFTLLPGCRTNPHRSPGGTVVGSTAAGAGLGALVGWAAGNAGAGAAVGAGVGLIAGAIQADADAQARDELDWAEGRHERVIIEERRRVIRRSDHRHEARARELLAQAQRTADRRLAQRLLKRSLIEYRTPEAHNALGELYESEGQLALAEEEYERALDLDPEYRPAGDNLAQLRR